MSASTSLISSVETIWIGFCANSFWKILKAPRETKHNFKQYRPRHLYPLIQNLQSRAGFKLFYKTKDFFVWLRLLITKHENYSSRRKQRRENFITSCDGKWWYNKKQITEWCGLVLDWTRWTFCEVKHFSMFRKLWTSLLYFPTLKLTLNSIFV